SGGRSQAEVPSTGAHASPNPAKTDPYSPAFYREDRGAFRLTTELLARLADVCKQDGIRSVLLTLGGTTDEIEAGTLSPREMLPHDQLVAGGRRLGFLEALALPTVLAQYSGHENLFFPKDHHWTATATRFVAPAVADAILRASGQE